MGTRDEISASQTDMFPIIFEYFSAICTWRYSQLKERKFAGLKESPLTAQFVMRYRYCRHVSQRYTSNRWLCELGLDLLPGCYMPKDLPTGLTHGSLPEHSQIFAIPYLSHSNIYWSRIPRSANKLQKFDRFAGKFSQGEQATLMPKYWAYSLDGKEMIVDCS